jgi:hypothetical protein
LGRWDEGIEMQDVGIFLGFHSILRIMSSVQNFLALSSSGPSSWHVSVIIRVMILIWKVVGLRS